MNEAGVARTYVPIEADRAMARRRPSNPARFPFRFRGLRTATVLFVALLVWLAVNSNAIVRFMNAYHKRNAAKENLEKLKGEVLDLEEKELQLKLGTFQNEKSVREDYHLVKPGEKLILIRPPEEEASVRKTGRKPGQEKP